MHTAGIFMYMYIHVHTDKQLLLIVVLFLVPVCGIAVICLTQHAEWSGWRKTKSSGGKLVYILNFVRWQTKTAEIQVSHKNFP